MGQVGLAKLSDYEIGLYCIYATELSFCSPLHVVTEKWYLPEEPDSLYDMGYALYNALVTLQKSDDNTACSVEVSSDTQVRASSSKVCTSRKSVSEQGHG